MTTDHNETMRVSIVTAVRNRADTVRTALRSVRGQTYGNVEHVVQDGASSDGTLDIVRAEAAAHLKLASEADTGIYDALNRGLARTTGDIVGLMHSDDFFAAPNILSTIVDAFGDPSVDAVYGDLDYVSFHDPSRIVRRWRSCPFRSDLLGQGWMPPHPTLYLRRQVLERHGGLHAAYDTSFKIAADYDAILKWFGSPGFRAVHIPLVFVRMRVGGASNGSVRQILAKSAEDFRALQRNRIGRRSLGLAALTAKNLGKLTQFLPVSHQRGSL